MPLFLLGLVLLAFLNINPLMDWWKLLDYKPPAEISALAANDTMTDQARHIFYVNQPKLLSDPVEFREKCTVTEQTIVLGCYRDSQSGIYIFDVKDERLKGVKEVTAAHEMLHGEYERLGKKEKNYINRLLNDFYKNDLHDKRILDTIDLYKKTEPTELVNEMHSIFGTEVPNLPPALEAYYQKYFKDRPTVVKLAQNYESEFNGRITKIDDYERQLNSLNDKIKAEKTSEDDLLNKINSEKANLDGLRSSGQTAEFNAGVPGYNALVDSYNTTIAQHRVDVDKYNQLVQAHNELAKELRGLYQSIKSDSVP